MSPLVAMDLAVFFNDPWWVVLLKALFAFVVLLVLTLFTIWYERRVVAFMQHRQGPNMNGPFGLLQSLADGMKLMFKEDFTPTAADKVVFMLAPFCRYRCCSSWRSPRSGCTGSCLPGGRPDRRTRCWAHCARAPR